MFDIQSNGTIYVYSPSAIFNNYGALKKSGGGGSSSVGMVVNNSGEVLVTSGLLSLAGGKSSGRFHADVNCTNQFTGPLHTLDVGASFIGAGVYRVCGGSLSSSVPFTVTNNFELGSGGQLTGTNTFVFAGPFSFREGNMVGPGKTVFRNTAIVSVSAFCVFGRTVDNYGIVRFESDPDLLATWNNMEGSITELRGQSLHAAVDNNAPFNNYGLLLKSSGGGTSQMNCSTTNWGIVRCQSGTLAPGKWSYVQKAGRTELAGGNYFGYLDIDRGILTGVGNIAGWVRNNGTNMPGASTTPFGFLSITNNQFVANPGYTNTGLGTLSVRLGGTTAGVNHDQMRGSGYINLNGFLRVSLVDGFLPSPGNIFTVMTYSARSPSGGKFTNSNAADLGLKELYLPTNLLLIAENAFPLATFSVNDGSTQSCCQPFELGTTALDLDGKVTNLAFYVEGIPVASLGGSDLTGFTNSVEIDFPGTYSLQAKATDDYGWSTWTTQQVTIVTRPLHMLSLGGMRSGGTFKFCMLGEEGRKYEVLANTNLNTKQWDVIGTMEYTNGIWRYFDTSAPSFPERYYQTRQLPLR